jgi:chromosome segregation ATPase
MTFVQILTVLTCLSLALSTFNTIRLKKEKVTEVRKIKTEKAITQRDAIESQKAYNELTQVTHSLVKQIEKVNKEFVTMKKEHKNEINMLRSEFQDFEVKVSNELRDARMERNQLRNQVTVVTNENRLLKKEVRKYNPSSPLLREV